MKQISKSVNGVAMRTVEPVTEIDRRTWARHSRPKIYLQEEPGNTERGLDRGKQLEKTRESRVPSFAYTLQPRVWVAGVRQIGWQPR